MTPEDCCLAYRLAAWKVRPDPERYPSDRMPEWQRKGWERVAQMLAGNGTCTGKECYEAYNAPWICEGRQRFTPWESVPWFEQIGMGAVAKAGGRTA